MSNRGVIFVDDVDVLSTYGVMGCYGCVEAMLSAPSQRKPYEVNWQDWSGVTVDVSTPRFNVRGISLPLMIRGVNALRKLEEFKAFLMERRRFMLECRCVDISSEVVFQGLDGVDCYVDAVMFKALFVEDSPYGCVRLPEYLMATKRCGLLINGEDLGTYGVRVNGVDSLRDALKFNAMPCAKYMDVSGGVDIVASYSPKSTPVVVKLQLVESSLQRLRNGYVHLVLKYLMSPGEKVLSGMELGFQAVKFYYNSADVSNLFVASDGSCVVDINLNITVYANSNI